MTGAGATGPGGTGPGAAGAPLIVTAELPPDLHRWATALRRAHFPPERNHLEAHVTLFHALPPAIEDELRALLARLAGDTAPLSARLDGVMNLGRGTALRVTSPAMLDLRARVADRFLGMLSAQDSHPPRLHITIQNKVAPAEARALQRSLAGARAEAGPIAGQNFAFPGLALFRYRGGPWEPVRRFPFRGAR